MKINCNVIRLHELESCKLNMEKHNHGRPINDEVLFKVTAFALNRADVLYYRFPHNQTCFFLLELVQKLQEKLSNW
jgi:hypothetical protein